VLVAVAVAALIWPEILAIPFGILAGWIGLALLARAMRLRRTHHSEAEEGEKELPEPADTSASELRQGRKR
jgi:hypothetical protein